MKMMNTLELIEKLQLERISKHIEPSHVPYLDLQRAVIGELKNDLNILYRERKIIVVETINGKAVKTKIRHKDNKAEDV